MDHVTGRAYAIVNNGTGRVVSAAEPARSGNVIVVIRLGTRTRRAGAVQ